MRKQCLSNEVYLNKYLLITKYSIKEIRTFIFSKNHITYVACKMRLYLVTPRNKMYIYHYGALLIDET